MLNCVHAAISFRFCSFWYISSLWSRVWERYPTERSPQLLIATLRRMPRACLVVTSRPFSGCPTPRVPLVFRFYRVRYSDSTDDTVKIGRAHVASLNNHYFHVSFHERPLEYLPRLSAVPKMCNFPDECDLQRVETSYFAA